MTGWTDYAFSSDNVAAHQAGLPMYPPSLEVQDATGRWVTAIEQIGIPVGRPQTVLVDLTRRLAGPVAAASALVTSMRVLWDQIRVGALVDEPAKPVTLEAARADLRERGFSARRRRRTAASRSATTTRACRCVSPWKVVPRPVHPPGRRARAADAGGRRVRDVEAGRRDRLSFDAAALPPLPAGWKRTYLLLADGFSKEMDINSATPDTASRPSRSTA